MSATKQQKETINNPCSALNNSAALCEFARQIKIDLKDLKLRDMIDIQSFIWVNGSGKCDE